MNARPRPPLLPTVATLGPFPLDPRPPSEVNSRIEPLATVAVYVPDYDQGKPAIRCWFADGTEPKMIGLTVAAAFEDFGETYDPDRPGQIELRWFDGAECGTSTWRYVRGALLNLIPMEKL